MTTAIGLLSNRVKKVPSTQVDENRYTFLSLQDSEPDLGVPLQNGNFLLSGSNGERKWSTNVSYNEDKNTLQIHGSYELNGDVKSLQTLSETVISNFSIFDYGSAKFLIQVVDVTTNEKQISELLVIHDNVNASATEYSVLYTGSQPLSTYNVTIIGNDVRVLATANSQNLLEYKVCEILMLA